MKTLSEKKAKRTSGGELLSMAPLVIQRNGRPLCAIMPLKGQDWEAFVLSRNPAFLRRLSRARKHYAEKGGVRLEDVKRRYKIK